MAATEKKAGRRRVLRLISGSVAPTVTDVLDVFGGAVSQLAASPAFDERALEVCTAARVAWATYYSAWLRTGPGPAPEAERFRTHLADALRGAGAIETPKTPKDRTRLAHYIWNVRFRAQILDLLWNEGVKAVDRRLDLRLAKVEREPVVVSRAVRRSGGSKASGTLPAGPARRGPGKPKAASTAGAAGAAGATELEPAVEAAVLLNPLAGAGPFLARCRGAGSVRVSGTSV